VIATNTNAQARREGEAGAQEELDRGAARSSDSENIERERAGPRDGGRGTARAQAARGSVDRARKKKTSREKRGEVPVGTRCLSLTKFKL
jgi:hypothetical protein